MTKLLLADDHSLFREGLKQILSKYDKFNVIDEASNSNEAIEKITRNDYDQHASRGAICNPAYEIGGLWLC